MLLVNSLVLFLSSILRGTVRCHQKWDLQCKVSLEMAGLHFYIDKIHNLYHENASLLDHNRCCQSEKHKNTFIQDPVWVRARIIVYVCHALLLVIKICRIGNNKTLGLTALTAQTVTSSACPGSGLSSAPSSCQTRPPSASPACRLAPGWRSWCSF